MMQPETAILWAMVISVVGALIVVGVADLHEHWNKCRHKWTTWSTPEKPETNHIPSYGQQTRCCKTCNQWEIRQIK
jgi:hypothetical protein